MIKGSSKYSTHTRKKSYTPTRSDNNATWESGPSSVFTQTERITDNNSEKLSVVGNTA